MAKSVRLQSGIIIGTAVYLGIEWLNICFYVTVKLPAFMVSNYGLQSLGFLSGLNVAPCLIGSKDMHNR